MKKSLSSILVVLAILVVVVFTTATTASAGWFGPDTAAINAYRESEREAQLVVIITWVIIMLGVYAASRFYYFEAARVQAESHTHCGDNDIIQMMKRREFEIADRNEIKAERAAEEKKAADAKLAAKAAEEHAKLQQAQIDAAVAKATAAKNTGNQAAKA